MLEPISVIAGVITSIILPKALEKVGEIFGEAALKTSGAAIQATRNAVQDKLQKTGTAGLLKRAEENPIERNVQVLEAELVSQMEEDQAFANQLRELVSQIQVQSPSVQEIVAHVRAEKAEIKESRQRGVGEGTFIQRIVHDSDIKDVKISNVSQEIEQIKHDK